MDKLNFGVHLYVLKGKESNEMAYIHFRDLFLGEMCYFTVFLHIFFAWREGCISRPLCQYFLAFTYVNC